MPNHSPSRHVFQHRSARGPVRIAAATTAVLGLAMLAGCSSEATSTGSDAGSSSSSKTIQFVSPAPAFPQWKTVSDCMEEEAGKQGYDYKVTGPSGTDNPATAMINQLQQATSAKVSGIVTVPASEAFGAVLKQAQDNGVVTTTLYGDGSPESGATVNVGADLGQLAALYVDAIAERPGPQKVGLVLAGDTGLGKLWLDGFEAAAAETDNVTVVGEVYTGDDAAKALAQTSALLTAHPDVNVVATHMGSATPGIISAIAAKDATDDVAFLGNSPANGGAEALESGAAYRMLVQDGCTAAKQVVDETVKAIDSGSTDSKDQAASTILVQGAMASKDDIQKYVDEGWL